MIFLLFTPGLKVLKLWTSWNQKFTLTSSNSTFSYLSPCYLYTCVEHNHLGSAVEGEDWVNQAVREMSLEIHNRNSLSLAVMSLGLEVHGVSRCANRSLYYQGKFHPWQLMNKNPQLHPETSQRENSHSHFNPIAKAPKLD